MKTTVIIIEDGPTNSMGSSGSTHAPGKIDTFEPLLTNKPITRRKENVTRFKDFLKNDRRKPV